MFNILKENNALFEIAGYYFLLEKKSKKITA